MLQLRTINPVKLEGIEFPAGTKIARIEVPDGVSVDRVFSLIAMQNTVVEECDGEPIASTTPAKASEPNDEGDNDLADGDEAGDMTKMSVPQLKEILTQIGREFPPRATKAQLLELINAADKKANEDGLPPA